MVDLRTDYVGLDLVSPLVVASAGITETVERMRKCQENGAGAVVMKSYFEEEVSRKSPTPRYVMLRHDMGKDKTFTFMSYEQASEWDIRRYAEEVARAKDELFIKIIPSLNCITDEGWVDGVKILTDAGADAIELNTSCPHGSITFRGQAVEETICATVEKVRKATSLPLVAKISPMLTSPLVLVKMLEGIGVNGVTVFNRMTALEIDVEEEAPIMHRGYAGHGGPWAIQYPLRWISQIRPEVSIDIAGSGGVARGEDMVKYFLVGANVVQCCSAVVLNGYEVLREILDGLTAWMERKGYERVDEFRCKVNPQILGTFEIDRVKRVQARIEDLCLAPCRAACPADVPAQAYVNLIAEGKFSEALATIRSRNPFQSVCGYACYHPCEGECVRGDKDAPIAIRALKRFVCDWGQEHAPLSEWSPEIAPDTGRSVAVIGAGPAGLTCAFALRRQGHAATVYEALPKAGGMMRVGIPQYRLPDRVLDEEIRSVERAGVQIKLNTRLGTDVTIGGLRCEGYDAVVLAIGAHRSADMGIAGEDAEGVVQGADFLRRVNLGKPVAVGRSVAVVGGGNTALDAARCALRLGAAEAYVVYRRSRAEMPANDWEVEEAEDEGVRVLYMAAPVQVIARDGKATGLRCRVSYLADADASGRRRAVPVAQTEFDLLVDTIIVAVSQTPDLSSLQGDEEMFPGMTLSVDAETGETNADGVFAAGDAAGNVGSVIHAVAAGNKVAERVHAYLGGAPIADERPRKVIDREAVLARTADEPVHGRVELPMRPSAERVAGFEPAELTLDEESAMAEARRCLACGCGPGCGICERVCIYGAVAEGAEGFQVDPEKCDGCGLCMQRCRNENITMAPIT